jgi:zinc transporter ZupT
MEAAWIRIPYPWVSGEAHHLSFVTNTGVVFEHTIDVAVATPAQTAERINFLTLIGLFVGVVPITLGMMFYPALRAGGPAVIEFALALTIGLLAFLFVDTLSEALDLAAQAAPQFHGGALVWLAAALTFVMLMAISRKSGKTLSGVALATSIAFGIGIHNLGEGLAIGAAFANGAAALGSFLVIGFTLHNITEGVGIAAPMLSERPRLSIFAMLIALAGLPAVIGIWIGSFAFSAHWAALALGIGAGAILQVIIEVGAYLMRRSREEGRSSMPGATLAGISTGVAVMYATALLIQI